MEEPDPGDNSKRNEKSYSVEEKEAGEVEVDSRDGSDSRSEGGLGGRGSLGQRCKDFSIDLFKRARKFTTTFGKFIGPGFMVNCHHINQFAHH